MPKILLILLLALLPGACGAAVLAPVGVDDAVDAPAAVDAPMWLPPELRQALQTRVVARSAPGLDRVEKLLAFMLDEEGMGLRYLEQPTYDVAESYRRRTVNCLSFTLMFVALAREAGVRAYPQASDETLSMRVVNQTLFRATHMNAGVRLNDQSLVVDVGADMVIAGRQPRRIPDLAAIALFHNNRAVEALLENDNPTASTRIATALAIDPANPNLWSNAGVIHWRAGRRAQAQAAYERALKLDRDHISALGNLLALADAGATGLDVGDARARLAKAQRKDPFSQFVIGESSLDAGDLANAIIHYQRAIRLLPDQPGFYRSLAEAYERRGDMHASRRARERAESLEAESERRQMRKASLPDSG